MRINNIGYLLKEGFRGIFIHGFMSFAAVCITVACLLIVGSFYSIMENVRVVVKDLNQTNEIIVYVDENVSEADALSVGSAISLLDNVASSRFINREDALDTFVGKQDNPQDFKGVDADALEHRYSVILHDNGLLDQTRRELLRIPNVADVRALDEVAKGFATAQDLLSIAFIVIIVVLLAVSLLIISNTVKLAMYDRKDEIAIMKMVGATNGFIRLPFVVEGFILGMLGAGIAFGLEWVLYDAVAAEIATIDGLKGIFTMRPFKQLLVPMIAVFGGAGMFVGIVGSWTSIRKFMDV